MSRETPKVRNPGGMLGMYGVVIALVVYLYLQVVKNYIAGGAEAPSLATVIIGGVLLLGGCGFIGIMAVRIYRQAKQEKKENTTPTDDE